MLIDLSKLMDVNRQAYQEFADEIDFLLQGYKENDPENFTLISKKIAEKKDWDADFILIDERSTRTVNVSQLLAYEYCLGASKISKNKVTFDKICNKMFDNITRLRIGNPIPGKDDKCLYGKSMNDKSAIPVTSKMYRMVMKAGAQHLDYIVNGERESAVFIYEKEEIKGFAKNEDSGKDEDFIVPGIDFEHISENDNSVERPFGYTSLISELRHTFFHEVTHCMEKEIFKGQKDQIAHTYKSVDGKKYINYDIISKYLQYDTSQGNITEPQFYSRETEKGKEYYFIDIDKDGNQQIIGSKDSKSYMLDKLENKKLDKGKKLKISNGLTTFEINEDGKKIIHNMITEGFVEKTARAILFEIAPKTKDIDTGRYMEIVEIADRVIQSRDKEKGEGTTYGDFLMHSSKVKQDLENVKVDLSHDKKADLLHYLCDYVEKAKGSKTNRTRFVKNMPILCEKLQLNEQAEQQIKNLKFFDKYDIGVEDIDGLRSILLAQSNNDVVIVDENTSMKKEEYIDKCITEYMNALNQEKKFFDGIDSKMKSKQKTTSEESVHKDEIDDKMELKQKTTINMSGLVKNSLGGENPIRTSQVNAIDKQLELERTKAESKGVSLDD